MAKVNKGDISRGSTAIPTPKEVNLGLVCFSFKYLDLQNDKFCLPDTTAKVSYLETLFDRLKNISRMTFSEFRQAGKALRSHVIRWDQTSEPTGYAHLPAQLQDCEPWQFSLAREELGRIHGFLLSDIFYVVWIDHDHKLFGN
jgi:hypothetical protein